MSEASQKHSASLPALYASWCKHIIDGPLPAEAHATCGDCAMCKASIDAGTAHDLRFTPRVKCCSYVPTLWNYLVGQILTDGAVSPEGRASVERRIAQRVGVTPLGLQQSPEYATIYKYAADELFGRSEGLRCPHYLDRGGGVCGIWQHRNAVCSTYFCKFEQGASGKLFWDALLRLLGVVERHLALWVAFRLDVPIEDLSSAFISHYVTHTGNATAVESRAAARQRDSDFTTRSDGALRDYYCRAAELVSSLSLAQLSHICGPEFGLECHRLRHAYDVLRSHELPEFLRLAASGTRDIDDHVVAVTGYSVRDMLMLRRELWGALFAFDGRRSTASVLSELASAGHPLDAAAVRRLIDFEILVAMPEALQVSSVS